MDMSNVTRLDEWRSSTSRNRRCPCGSEWFRLIDDGKPGQVVVDDETGTVTGYAGTFSCSSCGSMR